MLTKVKLPRNSRKHPLLTAIDSVKSIRGFARDVGVPPQHVHRWINLAREDRDFMLPAHYIVKICQLTQQHPYDYRPDVFLAEWRVP